MREQFEEVLLEEEQIRPRVSEIAARISHDYEGKDPLLVCVLKGAVFFMADLTREITIPCEMDFMAVSSYGTASDSSGVVRILKDLDATIEDRHVIIVEDIVDTGLTLSYLRKSLSARNPASVEVATLLTKPTRRKVDVPCLYEGFDVPDKFVVGYGLDYQERYRNLRFIAALPEGKL
ncbi:MAG: hypoxanthine phosphoribosyltransferase [Thermoleophilia bacterium]|nr:hypoxanthine phosphoribosyltransferase [Thermoleophilia bacterium]